MNELSELLTSWENGEIPARIIYDYVVLDMGLNREAAVLRAVISKTKSRPYHRTEGVVIKEGFVWSNYSAPFGCTSRHAILCDEVWDTLSRCITQGNEKLYSTKAEAYLGLVAALIETGRDRL